MKRIPSLRCGELEARLAPSASLVRDIETFDYVSASEGIESLATVGSTMYFSASTPTTGKELWKSDGTSAGTILLRDLEPGSTGSTPRLFTDVEGIVYFTARVNYSAGVWRSDGTAAGTTSLLTLPQYSNQDSIKQLTSLGGLLIFTAPDSQGHDALWRCDGTAAGTSIIRTGGVDNVVVVNNTLYFNDDSRLYRSDGTSTGTVLVYTVSAPYATTTPIKELTNFNGVLYFSGNRDYYGTSLWRSDGTSSGTQPVYTIGTGSFNVPARLTAVGNILFFTTGGGNLWKSDGTSSGTVSLSYQYLIPASNIDNLTNFNGTLVFAARTTTPTSTGIELWRSDGTAAGTTLISDILPGSGGSYPTNFKVVANTLYFQANVAYNSRTLWKTDGTSASTTLVRSSGFTQPVNSNGSLYFVNAVADQLWRSDGTTTGTLVVKDTNIGTLGSSPEKLTVAGDFLYFAASKSANGTGRQLWRSDGTSDGTLMVVLDPLQPTLASNPTNLTNVGGLLFFFANGPSISGLWRTDGTQAGTFRLNSRTLGEASQNTHPCAVIGNIFYFSGLDATTGSELWRSDGTLSGTYRVRDINPGTASSATSFMANVRGTLFFTANDGTHGVELWRSDGTSSGTVLVRDINPGPDTSFAWFQPGNVIDGVLFFDAHDDIHGTELWRSDGTSAGTTMVIDLVPGSGSSSPFSETVVGDRVFFSANTPGVGRELWQTDGTAAGTVLVRDLNPGSADSNPSYLTSASGLAYFAATTATTGRELWRTDGTAAGTAIVTDLIPGSASSMNDSFSQPPSVINVGGKLYYGANDGVTGKNIWRTNGTGATNAAALPVGDMNPAELTVFRGSLYFAGNSDAHGRELFRIALPTVASIEAASPGGPFVTGQTLDVRLTFSEPVTLAGGSLVLKLDSGGTALVNFTPFSGTTAIGTYTVQNTHTSPALRAVGFQLSAGATLFNSAGEDVSLAIPSLNFAPTPTLLVNPLAPTTLSAVSINLGALQRSRVTSLQVAFATPVDVNSVQIRLRNLTTGQVILNSSSGVNGRIVLTPASGIVTTLTLTFDNAGAPVSPNVEHGSLADGRWQLEIPYLQYTSPPIVRLFGDSDGNGTVDATDFSNLPGFGAANNNPFDYNNNGDIDATDLAQFGNRFGFTI